MSGGARVRRGAGAIARVLRQSTFDLRTTDEAGFRAWLAEHLPRWRADPAFAAQEAIRELRRAHPRLAELEEEHRRLLHAEQIAPGYPAMQALQMELRGVTSAIAGLAAAQEEASGEKREGLARKLAGFRTRLARLREREDGVLAGMPERERVLRVRAELDDLRAATGLATAEGQLSAMQSQRGRRSGRAGGSFEDLALEASRHLVLPEHGVGAGMVILRGVTLGAAEMEIDQLLARRGAAGERLQVVAMVEAKLNPNDLGGGFRQRQRNLAWLTGDLGAYDPERHRARRFPTGHFDREVVHEQDGERFPLGPGSFSRFRRDPATGFFLDGLYFVTRAGTLLGASTGTLSRLRHRVATDERFSLDDPEYLRELLAWCRTLTHELESPDVLRAYARSPALARQLLFLV